MGRKLRRRTGGRPRRRGRYTPMELALAGLGAMILILAVVVVAALLTGG